MVQRCRSGANFDDPYFPYDRPLRLVQPVQMRRGDGPSASTRRRAPRRGGATEAEVQATVDDGEQFPAKLGRTGFRRTFAFDGVWRGRTCSAKHVDVYAIDEKDHWLVV